MLQIWFKHIWSHLYAITHNRIFKFCLMVFWLLIAFPRLLFEDEVPSFTQLLISFKEQSLYTNISKTQVHPFNSAHAKNSVELLSHHKFFIDVFDIVFCSVVQFLIKLLLDFAKFLFILLIRWRLLSQKISFCS